MAYPWPVASHSPPPPPFPKLLAESCVSEDTSLQPCLQCDCDSDLDSYDNVPECCQGLPEILHIKPQTHLPVQSEWSNKPEYSPDFQSQLSPAVFPTSPFALQPLPVNDFSRHMMDQMNQQMRSMEDNMIRMQKHMEEQFSTMGVSGMQPGMQQPMVTNGMTNSMSTLPRMPGMFPKFQDMSNTLPRTYHHGSTGPSSPASSKSSTGSIYVKGPSARIIPSTPPQGSPNSGTLTRTITPASTLSRSGTPMGTLTRNGTLTPNGTLTRSPGFVTPDPMGGCITEGYDGKKQLKLQFDMHDFKPDEIKVKKDKNRLEVHAHHEEKQPDRISCRVFHQQYDLPKDVRLTKVNSKVTPDGYLTVESPVKPRHRVKFATEDERGRLKCQVQENRFPTQ